MSENNPLSVRKIYCLRDGSDDPNLGSSKNKALQKQTTI